MPEEKIPYTGNNEVFSETATSDSYYGALSLIEAIDASLGKSSNRQPPIRIRIEGTPTNEDQNFLNKIVSNFNTVKGFL